MIRVLKILIILYVIMIMYKLLTGDIIIGRYGGIYSYGFIGILAVILAIITIQLESWENTVTKYSYISLCYLVLLIFLPQIFAKLPIFPFVYRVYGHVRYITMVGHINPELLLYQTWPGIMLLGSITEIVSGIGVYILMIIPIMFYILPVPLMYLLMRNITRFESHALLGTVFFMFGFYGFAWFVPGALASFMMIMGVYILLNPKLSFSSKTLKKVGMILGIITIMVIITHFLTSIAWLILILDLLIFNSVFKSGHHPRRSVRTMLVLFFIIQTYWLLSFRYTIHLIIAKTHHLIGISNAITVTEKWQKIAHSRMTSHAKILGIKSAFTYLSVGIALIGIVLSTISYLKKKQYSTTVVAILILGSYAIGIPSISGSYGGEAFSRFLSISIWLLAMFISIAVSVSPKFRKIFIVILPVLIYLTILCTYGNMQYDYVTPVELAGVEYTSTHISMPIHTVQNPIWGMIPKYLEKPWVYLKSIMGDKGAVIIISTRQIEGYKFFEGKYPPLNSVSERYKKDIIYSSKEDRDSFVIYMGGNI